MMEVATTTTAIRRAKLQSNRRSPTNQHSVFFIGRMPFLSPNQQCQSNERTVTLPQSVTNALTVTDKLSAMQTEMRVSVAG